ncbi:MAG TPA: glycosyltransferase family 2 protein [Thermoanaerobaculia bacterium]|nr:glycosyltransferase family 2 protein [Thermoanaerobaculia bacterium]
MRETALASATTPPAAAAPWPRVAAIVLNYNGRAVTLQALRSLSALDYPRFDLVVVDNGSSDGSAEAIRAAFPAVVVLRTERNLGPAGGANLGIRWALERGYDYLLILNNDIEVDAGFLRELVAAARSDAAVGIVGPKALYHGERDRIWSAGGRLSYREAITRERGQRETDRGQYDRDVEVDYVNGCAMLVKREVFERAGLWDPVYQLCVEDADFCVRAKRLGYKCLYAHRARLWHMVSSSTGGRGYVAPKTFHSARSTAIFARRHGGPLDRLRSILFVTATLPLAFVRELVRGNQGAVVAKLRGFREGLRAPLPDPPRWPPPPNPPNPPHPPHPDAP